MEYTSKGKVDYDKMQEYVKKNGFSERAKKYIIQALLGIQIMGAVPAFGNDVQATEYDLNTSNGPQFEEVFERDNDLNKDILDKTVMDLGSSGEIKGESNVKDINSTVVGDFASRGSLDTGNLKEFEDRTHKAIANIVNRTRRVFDITTVNELTDELINESRESGVPIYFRDQSKSKEDDMANIGANARNIYRADDAKMIKDHFEKYYGPIRDNTNLSQKEKFLAAMSVLDSLTTYDYAAAEQGTVYANNAEHTSRNQYSSIKYGQTVCLGYADSVEKICGMLGVDCKLVYGVCNYGEQSPEKQKEVLEGLQKGTSFEAKDHAANIISFDDGTSYIMDMTQADGSRGMNQYKYMTDNEHFGGFTGMKTDDGKMVRAFCDVKMREAASKAQMMPREEITAAIDKAQQELPYIAKLESLDTIQQNFKTDNKMAAKFFTMYENAKSRLLDKIAGARDKTQALPSGMETMIADNQVEQPVQGDNSRLDETREQGQQNSFRDMISGNGEYARNAEAYLQEYHKSQLEVAEQQTQQSQQQALENDAFER